MPKQPRVTPQSGNEKAHPDALTQMVAKGGRWAAYQNMALDSSQCGHIRFIKFGDPSNSFATAADLPERHPDTSTSVCWAYCLIGEVDLTDGTIKTEIAP